MPQQNGLIKNELATGYEPEKIAIDPAKETVQGRVEDILKTDSPFVTQARTRAKQEQGKRGTLSSTMAIQAGETAAYNAALPIAAQDVQTSLAAKTANQAAINQALERKATAENVLKQQGIAGTQAIEQQQLRGDQATDLANIEANYRQIMQTNDSAARFFSQISASVGEILKEPGITVEAKQQLVDKQIALLKNGMTVIGGIANMDLTGLLNFE